MLYILLSGNPVSCADENTTTIFKKKEKNDGLSHRVPHFCVKHIQDTLCC